MEGENLGRDYWDKVSLREYFGNLLQWILPGIYEGDHNEDS